MARALIVGCGCRGRELGWGLAAQGWLVRGTTRSRERAARIEAAGIEPRMAHPDRLDTVLDQVGDVALVYWLLGSAAGEPEALEALHGSKLELLLRHLVDTPVRGFVYEAPGRSRPDARSRGIAIVREAAECWRIPVEVVEVSAERVDGWREAMVGAAERLTGKE
jgi:hypothetical protein